jgi:hypothetical protein
MAFIAEDAPPKYRHSYGKRFRRSSIAQCILDAKRNMPLPMTDDIDDPRPAPPDRPHPDECCQCGCDPCVYDLYYDALERYEAALAAWEARHCA